MNPTDSKLGTDESSFHLPIIGEGIQPSHLSVRLEAARDPDPKTLAVLYMHGFASSQAGEKAAFFRRRFRDLGLAFCSFDFQGHGASGGSMQDLTLTRNLADIGHVHAHLRERGYRRLVLFGSSMGAASALWYAALHGEGVAATISISPALEIEKSLLVAAGAEGARRWKDSGAIIMPHPIAPQNLGWTLIEDLRTYQLARLKTSYGVPALIFQGKNDDSVDWRTVVDFATDCRYEGLELHLMADGDHRLVDRLNHLWRLSASFLEAQGLV